MLIYDGKEFRNLEEQVRKNKDDISYLKKIQTLLNQFGIHVIGKVDDASQLPGTSDTFGNAFAVGLDAPYEYYIWTDLEPTPGWMNIGIFPAPSTVEGPTGPRGTSVTAATVTDTGYLVLTLTDADNNETQITVGYVKGPQGATGPRGIQGVKGDTGAQGPRGYTGAQGPRGYSGFALDIIAILSEEAELPDSSTAGRHDAYVIEDSGNYELFGLVESGSGYAWASFGYIAFSTNYVTASDLQTAIDDLGERFVDDVDVDDNMIAFNNNFSGNEVAEVTFAKINGQNIVGVNTNFSLATKVELQSAIDALILGTTVVAHAQTADALNNVSENSGSTQEDPFIFQGTGTNNNTSETPTSPKTHQLEKQGNTVVVNQKAKEINNTNYSFLSATGTFNSGIVTFLASAQYGQCLQYINVIAGHKYLIRANIKLTTVTTDITLNLYGLDKSVSTLATTNWQNLVIIGEQTLTGNYALRIIDNRDSNWDNIQAKDIICIDLTQWFGSDNIPNYLLDHPKAFVNYYNGSLAHNEGTLATSNGRYLVTIGFNQLNPATSDNDQFIGNYYIQTALQDYVKEANNDFNCYRIRVIPNTNYCISKTKNETLGNIGIVRFVDEDYNLISGNENGYSATQKYVVETPSNCAYIEISISKYADFKVCVNLSWDRERNGEYEDFIKYVYDTGTEPLLAFDVKPPTGVIERNTGEFTFTNETDISFNYTYGFAIITDLASLIKIPLSDNVIPKIILAGFVADKNSHATNSSYNFIITITSNGGIRIKNTAWTSKTDALNDLLGKTIQYELATPTTEAGTPFNEIIDVDDYGTMYWLDDNEDFVEVPQGCKLFYPADYALLIDDLGNYTNYDVTALAKKADLLPKLPDTSADGTYVLKATKSGSTITYTWEQE